MSSIEKGALDYLENIEGSALIREIEQQVAGEMGVSSEEVRLAIINLVYDEIVIPTDDWVAVSLA